MNWIHVSSRDISAIAYEDGVLYISFNKGGVYKYNGVSESMYNNLRNASSIGGFFHKFIKGNYPYSKV